MPTAQQHEQAAILIQSKMRGYLTRKKTQRPQLAKLENYETLVTGNDGDITFTPAELRRDGKFIFVGCSGMNSLAILCALINFNTYTPSKDGCDNIPKLFIIDNSMQVKIFWENLKQAFTKSKTQVNFNFNVLATNDKFVFCCRKLASHCDCFTCNNFITLTIIAKLRKITANDDVVFQFIRNVVEKMTFLAHDWAAKEPFDFIKQYKGNQPIYVYPSNIVEFLSECKLPDVTRAMRQVVTNICSLQPIVTLHTRTNLHTLSSMQGHYPQNVVKILSANPRDHFNTLEAQEFGSLNPKIGLFNSYVLGAVGAEPPPGSYQDPATERTVVVKSITPKTTPSM